MATPGKSGAGKGGAKSFSKGSKKPGSSAKPGAKKSGPKPTPTQHKPKPSILNDKIGKRKPPHLRYTEKELKVPQLNGIRPAGVQKAPNVKKGKTFVDDKDGMNAIMALVIAEKEGNIESKMMRARQMEEVREARRLEMEKRAEGKRAGLEQRKQDIKNGSSKKRRRSESAVDGAGADEAQDQDRSARSKKKRVSFG